MQSDRASVLPPVSSFCIGVPRAMIPRMTSAGSYRVSVVVDRSRFPKLFRFVEWRIDVQLAEVRDMLRLPMPEVGLESGQNFAAAASLVNLIAGASVWFYDASTAGLSDRDSGRRFRETLAAYWPWDDGEIVDRAEGTRLLYECVRNPLAHGFGMSRLDDEGSPIAFLKDSLTAERVAELDLAETRPQGLGPTIRPARRGRASARLLRRRASPVLGRTAFTARRAHRRASVAGRRGTRARARAVPVRVTNTGRRSTFLDPAAARSQST